MVDSRFNQTFDREIGNWQAWREIAMVVPSTSTTTNYDFFDPIGDMEEWVDERQMERLSAMSVSLSNRDFEKTVEIKRKDIEDDNLGMAMMRIDEIAMAGARKPEIEVAALLNLHMTDTTSTLYGAGFDTKALFSQTHAWTTGYTTSQDNLRGAATDNQGKLNLTYGEANLQGAWTQMGNFKNQKGRKIGGKPNVLMVSSSTWFAARKFLESIGMNVAMTGSTDVTAYERPNKNILETLGMRIVLNVELTDGYWIAFDNTHAMRPVLFQDRQPVRVSTQTTEASDDVFMRGSYKYGIDSRFAVAPGYWFYAVGGDGT
jgi:phage major head subunit gpT-like protein